MQSGSPEAFPDALPMPCFGFEDAIDAVRDGVAERAMIPIENSLHGRVADIHFLLPESGLAIVGEHFLAVKHCLVGKKGMHVAEAMSHPQAPGQCRRWLRAHGIRPIAHADTAAAALSELDRDDVAAMAADLYWLDILAEGIADAEENTTRFVVLARDPLPDFPERPVMTTFIFEVKNVPAALHKALGGFVTNGVNMTKLESHQRGASFSASEFYADIEGKPDDPAVARAGRTGLSTKWVRVLGTYRQARPRTVPDSWREPLHVHIAEKNRQSERSADQCQQGARHSEKPALRRLIRMARRNLSGRSCAAGFG